MITMYNHLIILLGEFLCAKCPCSQAKKREDMLKQEEERQRKERQREERQREEVHRVKKQDPSYQKEKALASKMENIAKIKRCRSNSSWSYGLVKDQEKGEEEEEGEMESVAVIDVGMATVKVS